jgi:hypothetical protein
MDNGVGGGAVNQAVPLTGQRIEQLSKAGQ